MAGREASGRSGAYGGGSDEAGLEDRRGSNLPLFLTRACVPCAPPGERSSRLTRDGLIFLISLRGRLNRAGLIFLIRWSKPI